MRSAILTIGAVAVSFAQTITIPDGTKLRVKLDQPISSATANEGQTVEFVVTDALRTHGMVLIPEGARVTGTIVEAQQKRRRKAGRLDFSVDRVRAIDGEWIPLRYSPNKTLAENHTNRSGIITTGVALVRSADASLIPAKGKDLTISKGVIFEVFTDSNHVAKVDSRSAAPVLAGL